MDCPAEETNHVTQDSPENNVSVHIKTETLPIQDNALSSVKLPPVKEEPHVDHSYINDSPQLFAKTYSTKLQHSSSSTLQEIKVHPQFIKEEANLDEQMHVKVEANSKSTKFKCSRCNLPFRNKYVYKRHCDVCHAQQFIRPHSALTLRKLIDCVKNNPCLYDVDHENYHSSELKSVIWSNIASECNLVSGAVASGEWKSLKNKFVKLITQARLPNGKRPSRWLYEKEMEFVMPFITDEDVHMNVHKDSKNAEEATNNTEEILEEVEHIPRLKRVSVSSTQQDGYVKRKRDDEQPSTSHSQPLDMFFLSMCATTKNLPEYVQLQVKKKIFQAVIEAEEIVAAMHNDQEKNNLMNREFESELSPFSVHSNVNEAWEDD